MRTRSQKKRTLALIFDVETTGLPPKGIENWLPETTHEYASLWRDLRELYPTKYKNISTVIDDFPYITQLSWVLTEMCELPNRRREIKIIASYNQFIQLPPSIVIPPIVEELTGISTQMCAEQGVDIVDALHSFATAFFRCNVVVAHNIAFDRSMIRAEIIRNGSRLQRNIPYIDCLFHPAYDGCLQVEHYDTMIRTAKLCQLYMHTTTGKLKLKMPKLVELYQVLFHQTPIHMHNSMVDTLVCMRCFLKIRHQLDIDDDVFEKMLAKYGSKIINKWVKPPTIVTRQL